MKAHPQGWRGFGGRLQRALLLLAVAMGRAATHEEFGQLVADRLTRSRPFDGSTVGKWLSGKQWPDLATVEAIAELCQSCGVAVDPGWLAYGSASQAPGPVNHGVRGSRTLPRSSGPTAPGG